MADSPTRREAQAYDSTHSVGTLPDSRGIWYSFRSRYRPDTRCLLTLPRGLGDCMNVASRLLRNLFAGSSDLGNNWIGHFNSPVNQMVCRSMVVPCLDLDTPVRSLGGAQGLRCACSSTSSLVWRLEHAIGAQANPPKRFASTHRSVPLVSRALCRL
jgi:hypothetical protein